MISIASRVVSLNQFHWHSCLTATGKWKQMEATTSPFHRVANPAVRMLGDAGLATLLAKEDSWGSLKICSFVGFAKDVRGVC